ncbi:MAG: RsmB/NOP family class I SAM-dependent RNA methyltransferase [Kiritimatiellae bacterium]|nr:RsmB/NOP family class I SAM-dependent RNA methyltransferase [Kiritimatiellia bacterium]
MNNNPSPRDARRLEIAQNLLSEARKAVERQHPLDAFLARTYRENRQFGSKDRKFYSAVLFAWFRWKGLFENRPELPPEAVLAYCYWLDANPPDPAFSARIPEPLSSLDGPLSEKMNRLRTHHPALATLDPTTLVPAWLSGILEPSLAESFSTGFLEGIQQRPPTWLRLPRLHAEKILPALKALLPDAERHLRCTTALATHARFNIQEIHQRIHPAIEIQDLASQAVGLICRPQPGETWWDLCAASGGKALHLADLLGGRGDILATDIRSASLHNLHQRAKRAAIRCIHTAHAETTTASDKTFDGILIDAPCSGIGTWGRNPDARWRLNEADIRQTAEIQHTLLESALPHLNPGGSLIYSVCTLTRAETTDQINTFLQKHTELTLDPFNHPLTGDSTPGTCFILPWQASCNAMFIARIKRKG